jgi:Ca2+ transporting ATPase
MTTPKLETFNHHGHMSLTNPSLQPCFPGLISRRVLLAGFALPVPRCSNRLRFRDQINFLNIRSKAHRTAGLHSTRSGELSFDDVAATKQPANLTLKDLQSLTDIHVENVYKLGVVDDAEHLALSLDTSLQSGLVNLTPESLAARQARYGENTLPPPVSVTFLELVIEALGDFTVCILLGAGVLSLGLQLFLPKNNDAAPDWVESASILGAVTLVVLVTAINNWQKEQQFKSLQKIQEESTVRAVRAGKEVQLDTSKVLVGDVLLLERGDILCADGVLIGGSDVKMDESHLTGESNDVTKDAHHSQALYAGSKVVTGIGRMIVTAVGSRSQSGRVATMIRSANYSNSTLEETWEEDYGKRNERLSWMAMLWHRVFPKKRVVRLREQTPLQTKLADYATLIGRVGLTAAVVTTAVLTWRFTDQTFFVHGMPWDAQYVQTYLDFFITGVTILVVAVPEGLPLAVTISLAFSVMRMLEDNNLVRHLGAAEVMGTATVICTDKTGTLTQNKMTATRLWLAGQEVPLPRKDHLSPLLGHRSFPAGNGTGEGHSHEDHVANTHNGSDKLGNGRVHPVLVEENNRKDEHLLVSYLKAHYSPQVLNLLQQGIALNSTATVYIDELGIRREIGNRTEVALLLLAEATGCDTLSIKSSAHIVSQIPFSSETKRMTTAMKLPEDCGSILHSENEDSTMLRVFTKGAAEIVIPRCKYSLNAQGERVPLPSDASRELLHHLNGGGLRLLCLAYRDAPVVSSSLSLPELESLEQDMTLLALAGLEDPLRPDVPSAIDTCRRAGIRVVMLTGDNILTATDIARQCGILPKSDDGVDASSLVMEGQEFRNLVLRSDGSLDEDAFLRIWPRLKILARCTPADKFDLVSAVHAYTNDVVAVTGDGTNDAPALRAADVGFAMNSGTKVAIEAADIVLMDDNFSSIVQSVLWGRNVYANAARFLQFQLTVNLVAVITAVSGALVYTESPLSALQMLWINLIMDSLASLALATDLPDESLLQRPPCDRHEGFLDPRKSPILKHVVGQGLYQLAALWWLLAAAPAVLEIEQHVAGQGPSVHHTLVFNAFVCMQLFNQVNSRKVSDQEEVHKGLTKARLFLYVVLGEAVLQLCIVQWGGEVFDTVPLTLPQWLLCAGIGAGSLLVRNALRALPSP